MIDFRTTSLLMNAALLGDWSPVCAGCQAVWGHAFGLGTYLLPRSSPLPLLVQSSTPPKCKLSWHLPISLPLCRNQITMSIPALICDVTLDRLTPVFTLWLCGWCGFLRLNVEIFGA